MPCDDRPIVGDQYGRVEAELAATGGNKCRSEFYGIFALKGREYGSLNAVGADLSDHA